MIKRIAALFLSFILLTGNVNAKESTTSDYNGASYAEAVETLNALGIVSLYEDGTFRPEQNLSRADCAAVILRLKGVDFEKNISRKEFPWSDVTEETQNAGAILKAYELGIMIGDGDGKYYPDNAVTMQQLEVMLLKILGYEKAAVAYGGYPSGYEKLASELALTNGIEASVSKPITRGNAAQMIFNSLDVYMMKYDMSSVQISQSVDEKSTILSEYFNIEKGTAQITANERASLPGAHEVGIGQVRLGDITVYEGNTGASDYFGYIVKYYFNTDTETLFYVTPDEKSNTVVRIEAEDLSDSAVNDEITRLYYNVNDKEKSYRLSRELDVVYNGCVDNSFDKASFNITCGYIELLDLGDDGVYDIAYINEYTDYVVTTADSYNEKLFGLYSRELKLDDSVDAVFYDENGEECDWKVFEQNNVVSVYASKDGKYVKGYKGGKRIEGVINSVTYDGGKTIITVDGTEYKFSDIPETEFIKLSVSANVVLYTNVYGLAAGFEIESVGTAKYGYLLKASKSDEDENSGVLKLVDIASHEYIELNIDEKIKLNGKSRDFNGDRYTFDSIYDEALSDGEKTVPQVLKYTLNSVGKINKLYTAQGTEYLFDKDKLVRAYSGSGVYSINSKSLAGRYKLDGALKIFLPDKNNAGSYDKELISYDMPLWNSNSYSIQVYDVDELYIPKLVVFNGVTTTTSNTRNIAVISDISTKCDSDDNIYTCISAYYSGKETEFRVEEGVSVSDLKPGYVVTLVRNVRGRVKSYTKLYDLENKTALSSSINTGGAVDFYSYYCGTAYGVNRQYMTILYDRKDNMRIADFQEANIYRYEPKSNKKVSSASASEIAEKNSKVFVNINEGVTRDIIIMN